MKKDLTPEQRAEIARRNGAKSKGPVTPEGKARSSQNAVTHGVYTRNVVTANENAALYLELRDDYLRHYEPEGRVERDLVLEIVNARWRLTRIVTMETAALDCGMERQRKVLDEEFEVVDEAIRSSLAFTGYDGHARNGIALLGRTENRLHRIILRCTAELRLVQRERRSAATPPAPLSPPPAPASRPELDPEPAPAVPPPQPAPETGTEKAQKRTDLRPGTAGPANPSKLMKLAHKRRTTRAAKDGAPNMSVRCRWPAAAAPPGPAAARTHARPASLCGHLNPVPAPTHLKMKARHARPLINW